MRTHVPSMSGVDEIVACHLSPTADDCSVPPAHLLSLKSVALPGCSLNASSCVPAVVPHYCTFQGTVSMCVLTRLSRGGRFAVPWTVAHQAPLSMGFSRQESWSGFPCPTPGDLLHPGIEPRSLVSFALAGRVLYH